MNAHLEIIDSFVDGERVDTSAFKSALADPAGRDYFVDAWMLREAVQDDRDSMAASTHHLAAPRHRTVGKWMVAAALAIGIVGGYAVGYQSPGARVPERPVATSTPAADVTRSPAFPAPPPTRVIQLEFQVDATRSGGD